MFLHYKRKGKVTSSKITLKCSLLKKKKTVFRTNVCNNQSEFSFFFLSERKTNKQTKEQTSKQTNKHLIRDYGKSSGDFSINNRRGKSDGENF